MAIDLLSSGLSAGCFFFLIWRLAEPRNRYVKGPAVFLCFAAVIAGIGGKWDNLPLLGVLYLLLELLFAGSRMLKLYLAAAYVSIRELVRFTFFYLANVSMSSLLDGYVKEFESGGIGASELLEKIAYVEQLYSVIFFTVLNILCFVFLYLYKKQLLRKGLWRSDRTALFYLMIPALTGYVYCILIRNIQMIVRSDEILLLDSEVPLMRLLVPTGSLLCLTAVFASALLLKKTEEAFQKEKEAQVYKNRLRDMEQYIGDLERMYGDVKSMRHDLKNYVADMQLLAEQENWERAAFGEYLQALSKRVDTFKFSYATGNPITDVVVNRQLGAAEAAGIRVECVFFFPKSGKMEAFDLSVLLNNALENAVEACSREAEGPLEISLTSRQQGSLFLISVKNTCTEEPVWKDGIPVSTKKDNGIHGQGIGNIEKIAEKYEGTVKIGTEDGVFVLEVLLKLSSAKR